MLDGGNDFEVLAPLAEGMTAPETIGALALALADDTPYPDWLAIGRDLATRKRSIDWLIGDWLVFGRGHFSDQIELALEDMALDPNMVRRFEKTAKAIPAHCRDSELSFEHHAHVADMPLQEALPLLKRAHDEKLDPRQFRWTAIMRKLETGQIMAREEDPEDDAVLALVRAWNRATVPVRKDFAEMVRESGYSLIEFNAPRGDD